MPPLRARQKFGKYVIERRLAEGGFAAVYRARDTLEGGKFALKIPYESLLSGTTLEYIKREIRLAAKLRHPHILPLKTADYIEGKLVLVTPLGEETLEERLKRRLATGTALAWGAQLLEAVAHAHEHRVIHCDIKPENILIFHDGDIRLSDFGIAKVAQSTLQGSGTGTIGFVAPEQAMGKPSLRSDVFAIGIVLYRMLAGALPEWPYEWPFPNHARLRSKVHPEVMELLRKACEVDSRKRYRDAGVMLAAFRRIRSPQRRTGGKATARKGQASSARGAPATRRWKRLRRAEFQREHGRDLETKHRCKGCEQPVSEVMLACPWCGRDRAIHEGKTRFNVHCPRCRRGLKSDWRYCPWCYGPGFEPATQREYDDKRYSARCTNPACTRRLLMPWMRYCPWCNRKVRRRWRIPGRKQKCGRCGWGVLPDFWSHCPWCAERLGAP